MASIERPDVIIISENLNNDWSNFIKRSLPYYMSDEILLDKRRILESQSLIHHAQLILFIVYDINHSDVHEEITNMLVKMYSSLTKGAIIRFHDSNRYLTKLFPKWKDFFVTNSNKNNLITDLTNILQAAEPKPPIQQEPPKQKKPPKPPKPKTKSKPFLCRAIPNKFYAPGHSNNSLTKQGENLAVNWTTIVFAEEIQNEFNFYLEINNTPPILLISKTINKYAIQISLPTLNYVGTAAIRVHQTTKGSDFANLKIEFYTHSLDFLTISQIYLSQMNVLINLLKKEKVSSETIDDELNADLQEGDIPTRAFEQLFEIYNQSEAESQSNSECPSLLHLAAKYDLKKVAKTHTNLPYFSSAHNLKNKDNMNPAEIATKHNFRALSKLFDDRSIYEEKANCFYVAMAKEMFSSTNYEYTYIVESSDEDEYVNMPPPITMTETPPALPPPLYPRKPKVEISTLRKKWENREISDEEAIQKYQEQRPNSNSEPQQEFSPLASILKIKELIRRRIFFKT
ncbi:DgyrCDS12416 [Dimorphilus gyrociliatus]|uniref:DgyrCDS12416 n=1 Tax=Dimorphilus gyrociliatus TaxID=2664684 RepID=A0A7I8W861_9ANNE|nr:DgyrCDS12416 [Dimorphilus gyrociliatus]